MFGRNRDKATATVQYCEPVTDKHGEMQTVLDGYTHEVILDVQPENAPAFRAVTKHGFHLFSKPNAGDVVLVTFDPKSKDRDVRIESKGDQRYDLQAQADQQSMENSARRDAILRGLVPPVPAGGTAAIPDADAAWWQGDGADDQAFANTLAVLQAIVDEKKQRVAAA